MRSALRWSIGIAVIGEGVLFGLLASLAVPLVYEGFLPDEPRHTPAAVFFLIAVLALGWILAGVAVISLSAGSELRVQILRLIGGLHVLVAVVGSLLLLGSLGSHDGISLAEAITSGLLVIGVGAVGAAAAFWSGREETRSIRLSH